MPGALIVPPAGGGQIADQRGDIFRRNTAGAQQARVFAGQIDDGGFHADRAGPAVEHVALDMREAPRDVDRARGRQAARRVGAGGGDGDTRQAQQIARGLGGGYTDRDAWQAGARGVAHARGTSQRQHQRQRAGPERACHEFGARIESRDALGGGEIGHMRDQGIETRAAFGGVDLGDRARIVGARPQPVDRFGREGDETAGA
jgi:hypothetical protein